MTRLAKQFKPLNLAVAALLLLLAAGGFLWRSHQISSSTVASTRPTDQTTLVFDYARLLTESEADLNQTLRIQKQAYEIEIAVVTVEEIPDGMTLEALAGQLLGDWDIGRQQNGKGILILAASNARKVQLSVTAGLINAFPDSFLRQIQKWPWQTYFHQKELSKGINRLLSEIEARAEKIGKGGSLQQ